MTEGENKVIVIRREDGKYFQGCGYGGPGHSVPYWTEDIQMAAGYKVIAAAVKAAGRYGGHAGIATADSDGVPREWHGSLPDL